MNITSLSVSLTVNDVKSSSDYLMRHFGFKKKIAADGFASLMHEASGINIIYMQTGLEVLPTFLRDVPVRGTILAFVTNDIEAEEARLQNEGVRISLPLQNRGMG
ncbi:VOC family protein [Pseudochryseolinea flava]|uniref:VOC family protein n=1 Tax=Pseudochryseolinea flava TaxID=2059302 RepID=UPI001C87F762|nr:VOC family protein [Pseudochryseolinea flava]